uniref:Auxin-responsive protein n=1 Tax=Elaeis guineensis var. tenera TaxID=51953 RepID=A0A6I9QU83_ELAGV|nr:auxin-responsive protein IAA6 isoform X1 [Elaeis guineensis]XP_019702631.1 auxin-responsive protein IAA6 isoform X1 [Elaeis guineensis]
MEKDYKNKPDACPQLLDLIPKERDWMVRVSGGGGCGSGSKVSEERKLELRLGPPGGEEESSVLSLGYFSKASKTTNPCAGAKRGFLDTVESKTEDPHQQQSGFFQLHSRGGLGQELSQRTNRNVEQQPQQQSLERKACSSLPPVHAAPGRKAGANNTSQTRNRTTSPAVVGWPPIRSFRKNLASSSSKPTFQSQNGNSETRPKLENCRKGLFVKINMDGIPIGRKIDLKAYDGYEKLSSAVEELFQGLLAAQRDPSTAETQKDAEERKAFTGLLDGTGEYTLVYEDNEGDRMLVGDVPWDMFVSAVKRLRVLKSSDLSVLSLGAVCRKRTATEC